jgi:hypothetical protein
MKHKHHIIPQYEGGPDNPSNLVELTVTQHAMWHFAEWQRKGSKEDFLAWKGLTGAMKMDEMAIELMKIGGSKGGKSTGKLLGEKYGPITGPENFRKHQHHPNVEENRSKNGRRVVSLMNSHPNTKKTQTENTASGCEKRKKKLRVKEVSTGKSWEFPSVAEGARSLGLCSPGLARLARGERTRYKGYTAEYL